MKNNGNGNGNGNGSALLDFLAKDTTRTDILNNLKAEGTSDIALGCATGLGMPEVRQILKSLSEEGLTYYDDRTELWFSSPSQRLNTLKREIKEIAEKIQLGFYEIGVRLREIRDLKLYQLEGYLFFEEFVESELNFTRRHAYRQISAAQVLEDIKPVCPNWSHAQIKESHLRFLTPETFSPDDRIKIWEEVEADLSYQEEQTGRAAKLTDRVVRRAVMQFQESQVEHPPELPPLNTGDWCRVRLRSPHIDTNLAQWNNKVVRVVEVGEIKGVTCCGPFGEAIEDCFYREELQVLEDSATQKYSIELTVKELSLLSQFGSCIEEVISYLLEERES